MIMLRLRLSLVLGSGFKGRTRGSMLDFLTTINEMVHVEMDPLMAKGINSNSSSLKVAMGIRTPAIRISLSPEEF